MKVQLVYDQQCQLKYLAPVPSDCIVFPYDRVQYIFLTVALFFGLGK